MSVIRHRSAIKIMESQPTQLLQHALATPPQCQEPTSSDCELAASPNDDSIATRDISLDSMVVPARPETPCYHLQLSLLRSPDRSGVHELADDSLEEKGHKNGEQAHLMASPTPVQGSSPEPFHQHGDSPLSASAPKVIATRTLSCRSPPTTARKHPISQPTKFMPTGNRYYRRSPSFASQDSFAGPISQDPAERYLASAKQFDVPLPDLGETPTQEAIHSPSDPGATLPEPSSQHRQVFEAAVREYEQRASGATSISHPHILVAATPSNSSGDSQNKEDAFSFQNRDHKSDGHESRFKFDGPSSFDKMLDRDLADAPDSTQPHFQPTQVDGPVAANDTPSTPPRSDRQSSPPFDWIAPPANATVASSHPRSLLRMVHPGNHYRIAKMRNLAGNTEPPSCITIGAETQPSHEEETQPCNADHRFSNVPPPARLAQHQEKMAVSHQKKHDIGKEDELDVIPDSEPLRGGASSQTPTQSNKNFRPISPMSEQDSGDLVPDSQEVEESEADVPLADELASVHAKRSVAPTGDTAPHGSKSTARAKAPLRAVEKQPQKPISSTKVAGVNPSNMEFAEIPTSLPEQDLQNQTFLSIQPPAAVITNMLPSKERRASGRSRARPDSTTCPSATKPAAGRKRSHSSDTDSSNDLSHRFDQRDVRSKVREEEEETDPADGRNSPSPPPPPPKPDTSRKRRRTENVNPTRGTSKTSTSTRTKRSETPTIVTRSVKRIRSGVSSTRGLSTELATRVFALWKQDGHFYSGVVYSRGLKNKYLVKFDDLTEDEVELKNMRRRELLVGDRVILIQDSVKCVVSNVNHADPHSRFTMEVDDGDEVTTVQAAFSDIRIANRTIQNQWKERMVVADSIVTVVKPKPLVDSTPSKQSVVSTTSGRPQRELAKTGFVVTISPKNGHPVRVKEEAMHAIKEYGGMVIEDWSSVFIMEGKHSQSNKRWVATAQDFRWKSEVKLDRVFLLSDDAHQKPKFLLALALGIPCLSFEWLTREGNFSSDWQPFLLPAGYSDTLGARVSQLVDLDWGNCTEHLVDIMSNEVPIKLFSQKTVLCIGSDLVPRKNASDEASRYVPWIILCMGAAKVEAVADTKQVSASYMQSFDYIIVKERNILRSVKLRESVVVGDVNWVKECLVSSRLSTPALD